MHDMYITEILSHVALGQLFVFTYHIKFMVNLYLMLIEKKWPSSKNPQTINAG